MNFNYTQFATQLDDYHNITVERDASGNYAWQSSDSNDAGNLNTRLKYTQDDFSYASWYPETTIMQESAGMVVSNKVDYHRTTGDDHLIILTGYALGESGPKIVFAKVSVQFHGNSDLNVVSETVRDITGQTDFGQVIYDSLHAQIRNKDFGSINDSTAGRQNLPDIARANVNAMLRSVN